MTQVKQICVKLFPLGIWKSSSIRNGRRQKNSDGKQNSFILKMNSCDI